MRGVIKFPNVIGEATTFEMRKTEAGYDCLLDGIAIPAVLSQKLVIGQGVPKVVLEIAVKTYQGLTETFETDSR